MKQLRHVLALTLVFCMVFGMVTPSLAVSGEISVEEDYGIPVEEDGGIEIEVDDRSDYDIDEDREELSVLPKQDETADETNTTGKVDGYEYNIIHLDCGRKYFSVDSIKQIIDNAAKAGFNYIQLAVGNDGMRFLLDDMSLTVNGTTYESDKVKTKIHEGNEKYTNYFKNKKDEAGNAADKDLSSNELTQSEMDEIIGYAHSLKMGVIPLINTPGHMDAILYAAEALTEKSCAFSYKGNKSERTIDVTPNSTAVAFTKAFLNKYITYFAGKGCKYFNMGADEYANDKFTSGAMGFGVLQSITNGYENYITYINDVAGLIKKAGMTPMAFNDGIYYNNDTDSGTFDTDIIVEYWSSGWGTGSDAYKPMSASSLRGKGFKMVNTHGDYYWVLGKPKAQCSPEKARGFNKTVFPDSNITDPSGSTFCIWSDYPGAETEASVISKTAKTIEKFGGALPTVDSVTNNGGTTDTAGETVEITLNVGVSTTRTINGVSVSGTALNDDYAKVVAADSSVAGETKYEKVTSIGNLGANEEGYYISYDGTHFMSYNGSKIVNSTSNPTKWNITKSGDQYILSTDYNGETRYLVGGIWRSPRLSLNGTESNATKWNYEDGFYYSSSTNFGTYTCYIYYNSDWTVGSANSQFGLPYTKTTTTAQPKTTVTITGKAPTKDLQNGYTTATVGNDDNAVTYNITVNAIESAFDITVSSGGTAALNVPKLDESIVGNTTTTYEVTEYITVDETNGTITAEKVTEDKTATVVAKVKNAGGIVLATYTYNVTITKENLDEVTPITVEYWITNVKVNTLASDATEKTIYASDSTVYSENGALLSGLVPEKGKRNTQSDENLVFWKGTRLVSGSEQTTNSGDDKTGSGDDFKYIRYWDSKWSFSADGVKWKDFNTTDQIIAYYLQRTEVTDEINTEVVDWGEERSGYGYSNFVLMDYAVMYQSGERLPGTFPVANKTIAFHCDPNDTNTVKKYSETSTQWYNYYRQIGMIRGQKTSDYEVYMITLTPTSTNKNTQVASYASSATSYTYDYSNEKVIWVDDIANLGDFADQSKWYTSVSGDAKYGFSEETSVGGMPIVPGVEITNRHGLLVTYYIRAKATTDSLTVHYMDRTNGNKEFYSYPINVNQGTTFKTGPYLPEIPEANGIPTHINNGDVVNSIGKTQYVSSVLATMPEISATYRYSSWTCEEVIRSDDGKDLYLYYTFKNTHSFVVDFGVPLHLTTNDIIIDGDWTSYTATQGKYGTVEYDGTKIGGGITYIPTKVMQGRDEIAVTLNPKNASDKPATHFIYLYPATNVLYEENVITNPAGTEWTTVNDTNYALPVGVTTQSAEKLGNEEKNVHGYDDYYSENTGFSGGSAYKAELTLPAGERNVRTKDVLSFTFTGTGFDLISECGTNTGALLVNVYRVGSDGSKTLAHGFLVDTYFSGDKTYITGKGILDYQVPVVRDFIKKTENDESVNDYGTYEVTVKGFLFSNSGAAVNSTNAISTYSTQNIVEETLASLGIPEEDFDLYEVVYMDDNSVLNGGTGAETSVVKSDIATFVKDIAMGNALELNDATDGSKTAYVYVDGIRIYNTIDPSKQPEYKTSEKNTEYYNVYDFVLNSSAGTSDKWDKNSAIYIEKDGYTSLYNIADYKKQGPENEIYLTSGNAVVFALDGYNSQNSTAQVAVKAVSGKPMFNGTTVEHSTELYYELKVGDGHLFTDDKYGAYVILGNDDEGGNSVLSISGLKVSSNIQLIANSELGDKVVSDLNRPTTEGSFEPDTFSASIPKTVKINRRFTVSISASTDVKKVVVKTSDGTLIGAKIQSQANNTGDTLRYSIIATAPNVKGSYTIFVYAENSVESGTTSDPIELTITVK